MTREEIEPRLASRIQKECPGSEPARALCRLTGGVLSRRPVDERGETTEVTIRLRQEIDNLIDEQTEALKRATFIGMTPDDAKMYDARWQTIMRLIQQLAEIQKDQ